MESCVLLLLAKVVIFSVSHMQDFSSPNNHMKDNLFGTYILYWTIWQTVTVVHFFIMCRVLCVHYLQCYFFCSLCVKCVVQCAVCSVYSMQCVHCAACTMCSVYSVHCVQCAACTVHSVYNTQCLQCTVYAVHRVCSAQCVQCDQYDSCGQWPNLVWRSRRSDQGDDRCCY